MDGTTSVDGNVVDSQIWLSHDNKNFAEFRNFSSSDRKEFSLKEEYFPRETLGKRTSVSTNTEILLRFYTRKTKVLNSEEILQRANSSLGLLNREINGSANAFSGRSVKILHQN